MKASPLRLLMLLVLMAFAFGWIGNLRQLIFFSDPSLVYPKPIYANPFYIGKASGADFGQVYLGAKAWLSGENPYQPSSADFRDPIARIPAYPPLVFFVYLPLAKLSFSLALAIHLFLENFIFLVLLFLFSGRDAFFSVLAAVTLTPLGVTFLQQGQFDLYTASCFFLLGITGQGVMEEKRRAGKYFLAGLFAALKWTALPLLLFSEIGRAHV